MTFSVIHLRSSPLLMVTGSEISMLERLNYLKIKFNVTSEVLSFASPQQKEDIIALLKKHDSNLNYSEVEIRAQVSGIMTSTQVIHDTSMLSDFEFTYSHLKQKKPDLLFINARDALAVRFSQISGIPSIYFLTEDLFERPVSQSCQDQSWIKKLYSASSKIVVPSRFLSDRVKQAWDITPSVYLDVINPRIAAKGILNTKRYISILQPYEHKGIAVFIELAKNLKDLPFLCSSGFGKGFTNYRESLKSLKNVQIRGFSSNISSLLHETLILLVPSLCRDVFPRVILEAMSAGVPVIASDIGGCREAGGDAAMYVPVSISENCSLGSTSVLDWMRCIRMMLANSDYSMLQKKSLSRYAEYQADLYKQSLDFVGWCKNIIDS